jgi:hypothetical protein
LKSTVVVLSRLTFLLIMVPETTVKWCFVAQTGRALKARRVTTEAVSSHSATSPTLRFA